MTAFPIGTLLEAVVAILLALTVGYCFVLNRKLARLRSHRQELREVVHELEGATARAEQAISGLRLTTDEADGRLSENLAKAARIADDLTMLVEAAERSGLGGGVGGPSADAVTPGAAGTGGTGRRYFAPETLRRAG